MIKHQGGTRSSSSSAAARQRAQQEAARRRAQQEAARRKAAQEAAARKRAEEEARKRAQQEASRRQEEARRKAEQEAARIKANQEAARRKAEQEAAQKKAQQEAERKRQQEKQRQLYEQEQQRADAAYKAKQEAQKKAQEAKNTGGGYHSSGFSSSSKSGGSGGSGGYSGSYDDGGYGSYSDGGYSDYGYGELPQESQPDLDAILEAYKQMIQQQAYAAMQAANGQIDSDLSSALANYDRQRSSAAADYQKAIDNSELNRFWAGKELREQQANNGLLNAGSSRQDKLYLDNTYQNNLTKILNERAATYSDIARAMQDAQNKASIAKAQNQQNYVNSQVEGMTSVLPTLLSGYTGNSSDLLSRFYTAPTAPMATTQNANASTAPSLTDYLKAYQDGDTSYWKKKNNQKYTY